MDIKNIIEEINKVQFINGHYQDVNRYRDAFTDTPDWLINALDNKIIELKNYNTESMFDYGSYGVIHTNTGDKEFYQYDWIIKEGDVLKIKKGKSDYDKFLNHVKKWNRIITEEIGGYL